eukprot:723276_1
MASIFFLFLIFYIAHAGKDRKSPAKRRLVDWSNPMQPNAYNMYSLVKDTRAEHVSFETLQLIDFILSLPNIIENKYHQYYTKPDVFVSHILDKKTKKTERQGTIGAAYPLHKSTIVLHINHMFGGKASKELHGYRMRCKPIQIQLNKPTIKEIEVYSGVYDALNTALFYEGLLSDIQSLMDSLLKQGHKANQLIWTGHDMGGSMATLLSLLWIGDAQCDFVQYFKTHASPDIQRLMDGMKVYTFGAFSVVGHEHNEYIQSILPGKDDIITHVIDAQDPVPMVSNGQKSNVDDACAVKKGILLKPNEMDHFVEKAYYGPIGRYLVTVHHPLEGDRIAWLNQKTKKKLFQAHLVHGAETFALYVEAGKKREKIAMQHHHAYSNYQRVIAAYASLERAKRHVVEQKMKRAQYEQMVREDPHRHKQAMHAFFKDHIAPDVLQRKTEYMTKARVASVAIFDGVEVERALLVVVAILLVSVMLCATCGGFLVGYWLTKRHLIRTSKRIVCDYRVNTFMTFYR